MGLRFKVRHGERYKMVTGESDCVSQECQSAE